MKLAQIAINRPLGDLFYYTIPDDLDVFVFQRVAVNFAGRDVVGFVMDIVDEDDVKDELEGITLKTIAGVIDSIPIIDERIVEIAQWMTRFYLGYFGEVISAITPSAKNPGTYKHKIPDTLQMPTLTDEQNNVYNLIKSKSDEQKVFLLHGVTGSGKTEVYKHLVKDVLNNNQSAIILIPEISLTPQTLERFYESFGKSVAVYHSRLTQNQRFGEWMRSLNGDARVVIGPRSAVFAPVKNLGLIIIDEEHEGSYKAQRSPRYHARQVAFHRIRTEGGIMVLGSATPQVESYYFAKQGVFQLVELKNRYGNIEIPKVEIVDLKKETAGNSIISKQLLLKSMQVLKDKKQVIFFLNRRGYSPVLICKDCGYTFTCPNCDVSLTFHKQQGKLMCHHCEHQQDIPTFCPECKGYNLNELGSGTEKLEATLELMFPNYRIARMDLDTTKKKGSFLKILTGMKKGEIDILVGTQMIAKGHDIAGVQLVGALLPDIILAIPDFRSSERAFVLLTQVIGRAGRRQIRGNAIIQTYMPEHYSIRIAAEQDYKKFFDIEIEKRKDFDYPPYTRMGRIVVRGLTRNKVLGFVNDVKPFIKRLKRHLKEINILGPVSCPIEKLNNQYRYHIILKAKNSQLINTAMLNIREFFRNGKYHTHTNIELDVDPINLV